MAGNLSTVVEKLRSMHALELNSSTNILSCLTITMINNNNPTDYINQCEVYGYHADTLYENREFQKAESVYRKALSSFKSIPKTTSKTTLVTSNISEITLKNKIYQCCSKLNNESGALAILESIPQKQRPPKVSLGLAKLYQKREMDRPAITCYKEVLKRCPLALDCAIELLNLGEHPNVVISLVSVGCNFDWLPSYIKAHALMVNKEYAKSVAAYEALVKRPTIVSNPSLLCDLATAYCRVGNYRSGIQTFRTLHLQDPRWIKGMDLYAYLLCEDERSSELENLAMQLFTVSEIHPEPWVAMGYNAQSKGDYTKAVYLAARATELDITCIQALLLKGVSLRMLGEVKIAITHFRQALKLAPRRLECYVEIVGCFLQEKRINEALTVSKNAIRVVGPLPNALVLQAGAMLPDKAYDRAIKLAERALSIEPNHQPAIEMLSTIAQKRHRYNDAIKFLRNAIQLHGSSNLHTMLADCYFNTSKFSDAVDHYNLALSLNPNNKEAKEGLKKVHGFEQSAAFETDQDEENAPFETAEDEEGLRMATNIDWPHETPWFS
uniref:Anaphase-promoting complex subunit 7 n=1 Tax=Phallusia mammillata TaxID=59560 RepID=A0A6F9D6W4_9ASCI|nr:anaphase-promoting complex subunit 7 [Phallusia mammillata]